MNLRGILAGISLVAVIACAAALYGDGARADYVSECQASDGAIYECQPQQ